MRQRVERGAFTPLPTSDGSRAAASLPGDLILQTSSRVWAVGLVFTGLWTFALVINGAIAPLVGHLAILEDLWPVPMLPVSLIGLALSVLMTLLARWLAHRPKLLLDLSAGFLVITCMLGALLGEWLPPAVSARISWICILIVLYPAIIPCAPGRTLLVSLVAASTEPVALWITHLRSVPFDHSAFYFTWSCVPGFLAAVLSVVPSRIIRRLGQQVRKARELGSYRLEVVLGKGGMGEVYRASHQMLARPAAVKLINSEMLTRAPENARVLLERFRREAQAIASLGSPHTIDLYDFGATSDGTFFLVMELLDGLDLQTLVERFGPVEPERCAHLLIQACHSLHEAHVRGLVHRDIKPSNIFTCRMGLAVDYVKVLDFGLVKGSLDSSHRDPLLTAPDATAGTPAYMAPEMISGTGAIDGRVDIYALGCVAYWLLTGKPVFEGPNALQILVQHVATPPVPPSRRSELEIPAALEAVVLDCLAKGPEDRPSTAEEVALRLHQAVAARPWTETRARRWWERHHPETARLAPTRVGDLTLTRIPTAEWTRAGTTKPLGVEAAAV
jgi:eukaryotic-like serine/threonine-protein kinase